MNLCFRVWFCSRIQAFSCRVCCCSPLRGLYPIWFDAFYSSLQGCFFALFFNFGIYSMFNCHAQHITNFYINLLDYQKSATCSPVFVTFPCNIVCVCVCVCGSACFLCLMVWFHYSVLGSTFFPYVSFCYILLKLYKLYLALA